MRYMLESERHPLGAIAFAEARGQSGPEALKEIVLKKFDVVNEVLANHPTAAADPPRVIFNPGTCSI